jgi:RNA polymerase sigma factor (sigma-70 family)
LKNLPQKSYALTQDAFDHLLASLDPDREEAARKYEELRASLFTFFAMRGAVDPLSLIDETINRIARRLSEGANIFADKPSSYFYAVARNVWRETLNRPTLHIPVDEVTERGLLLVADPYELLMESQWRALSEERLACIEQCLQKLAAEEREVLLEYYRDEGAVRIESRKQMAQRLTISPDLLRQRVARLKLKLGACAEDCMKQRRAAQSPDDETDDEASDK